jgi:hypothetical protein
MKKKLIFLCIAISFFIGFPAASSAAVTWLGEIWYGGYVDVTEFYDPGSPGLRSVAADTAIVVFNPNPRDLRIILHVFDKKGETVKIDYLIDGGEKIVRIPARGWAWTTLGMIVPAPTQRQHATKYTFRLLFGWDDTVIIPKTSVAPVVEVKEVIYKYPGELYLDPADLSPAKNPFWNPSHISTWSETSLGGDNGNGVHWR